MRLTLIPLCLLSPWLVSCGDGTPQATPDAPVEPDAPPSVQYPAIAETFGDAIDPSHLPNYANQPIPTYIRKDNSLSNPVTNTGATLGRVLFYDKGLSVTGTIACASCHQQKHAFSDPAVASAGANGTTGRHAMRLINARFGLESRFFWDRRAPSLEFQTTQPIQNHAEMGYSGANGDPSIAALITKLQAIPYYQELFTIAYGDPTITEERMQTAIAQFVRSIQSFDSKYDANRALVTDDRGPFPNFNAQENAGLSLFMGRSVFDDAGNRTSGGLSCVACHSAPEFDIDPNLAGNNGVAGVLSGSGFDTAVTRAPSLRDLIGPDGAVNSPFMHTGEFTTLQGVFGHYDSITISVDNPNLDARLVQGTDAQPIGQQLHITTEEAGALSAFLHTMTGQNVYTDKKWGDPFPKIEPGH